jgi:hypothetical protein
MSLGTIQNQLGARAGPGQLIRRHEEERGAHEVCLLTQKRVAQLTEQTL